MTKTTKLFTLLCCCAAFALGGCASTPPVASPKEKAEPMACIPVPTPLSFKAPTPPTPPAPAAAPVQVVKPQEPAKPPQDLKQADERFQPLNSVKFGFDSYVLDASAKKTLEQFYLSVKGNPVRLTLEGFCDERGDEEYNLGLADHRSNSVRKYLSKLGLDPESMQTVGYGREYPADPAHTKEAWQANRRVEIVKQGAPKPGSRKRYGTEE